MLLKHWVRPMSYVQPTANKAAIGAAAPRTRQIGREGSRANCSVSLRALLMLRV